MSENKSNGLTQAINFALDVQNVMQEKGACMMDLETLGVAIAEILPKYPGHEIGDDITFSDRSVVTLTSAGFKVH